MMNKVEICGVNTSKLPVLSEEEKKTLFSRIQQGDKQARQEFIYGNLRLVLSILQRFQNRGESADDLFQIGCIGLIKALDNFDPAHEVKFSTYAVPMIVLSRKRQKMRPRKWTETAIKQAFDNFIKQHDRLPTKQEMYEKYNGNFPRPLSVKIELGVTIGEYFKLNYPTYLNRCQSKIYGKMPKEYWINNFKKQYVKLNYPIESEYNALREPKTPNTQTLAKIIGVSTWGEVLNYCGFEKDTKVELRAELDFEKTLDNYQKLNSKLQEILKNIE